MDEVDVPDEDMSQLLNDAFDTYVKTNTNEDLPKVIPSKNETNSNDKDDILKNFENELSKCLKNMSDSLSSLTDPTLFGDGPEEADDIELGMDNFLEGLLNQFLSKDLVYPPLKLVANKYPKWLEDNKNQLSADIYEQRLTQYRKINEVCKIYEGYNNESDGSPVSNEDLQRIMSLIEEAMSNGVPPAELVEDNDGSDSIGDMMKNFQNFESKIDMEKCAMM